MRLLFFLLSFSLWCSAGLAQNSGTIAGKLVDEFGDPVSDAAVVSRNGAGQEFNTTTRADGEYKLDNLAPGVYQVTITVAAMKKFDRKDFVVGAAKTLRLDVTMLQPEYSRGTLGEEDRYTAAYNDAVRKKQIVPAGPTPRLPDGKPDLSGFWWGDGPVGLPERARPRPWADAVRTERKTSNMRDHPFTRCLPGSIIEGAGRGELVHTSGFLAILNNGTSYEPPRQIFIDGRSHPRDANPTWQGHSIGRWEGDTLVIDTVGFNGLAWYDGGLPSTEGLHVVERYRRPDLGHLEVEITVDDPAVLEKPWTEKRAAHLFSDGDVDEYVCTENNKDVEHMVGK